MSETGDHNVFVRAYRRYIGPGTPGEAVGYWVFLVGAILGVIGIVVFLYSTTLELNGGEPFDEREIAVILSSVGLMLLVLGVVIRLPSDQRVTLVALVGAAVTVVAVAGFIWAYPSFWNVPGTDYSGVLIAVYAVGIGLIVLSAILLPAIVKTPDDVFEELAPSKVESKATFELYRDRADEWRWRLRHDNGNIIATSGEGYSSKQRARDGLASVRKNVPGAEVVEIERPEDASQATFEVYEDQAGEWRWRLRHDNGNIIGDSGEGYYDRGALDEAVERVKAYAPMANVLRLDNGAFDVYAADGAWRWRLLNSRGRIVAESPDTFERRADAVDSLEPLRDVDSLEPDLQRENDRVRWSLTVAGDVVATGVQPYANERNANEAIERAKHLADTADVLTLEAGAFDLYRDQAEEWRWRLLASNGRIIADSGEGYGARAKARQGIASVQRNAPDAPVRG